MKKLLPILACIFLFYESAQAQIDTSWTRRLDSGLWDEAHAVVTDPENNVYVAGWAYQWGQNWDIFFAKYSPSGQLIWQKQLNYSAGEQASHLIFHEGFLYVAGYSMGGGSATRGSYFAAKYSANGDSIWTYIDDETGDGQVRSMKLDSQGNLILAGYNETSFSGSARDFVTMKINPSGNRSWIRKYDRQGVGHTNALWDMCLDNNDNIVVTGACDDTTNTANDIVTLKYNANGDSLWLKKFERPGYLFDAGRKVVTDQQKNIYVAGYIELTAPAQSNIILLKYDSAGQQQWVRYYDYQPAPQSFDDAVDLKIDPIGNLYLTGVSSFNNSQSTQRVLVAKFSSNGDTLWTRRWGTFSAYKPERLEIDSLGNMYIAGSYFEGAPTGFNAFALKYDGNGNLKWWDAYRGNPIDNKEQEFYALALDANKDVISVGRFYSPINTMDMLLVKYNNGITSIDDKQSDKSKGIQIFPNPTSGPASVLVRDADSNTILNLLNLNGKEVCTQTITGENTLLDISHLPKGMYLLRWKNGKGAGVERILKE
jgi:uncharacterized delta-60 repeat protein